MDSEKKFADEPAERAAKADDGSLGRITVTVTSVFIFYALLPGPLTWLERMGVLPNSMWEVTRWIFLPIILMIHFKVPGVSEFYTWWCELFP